MNVIACVSNSNYIKYTRKFLKSVYNTNPNTRVHVALLNVTDSDYNAISNISGNIICKRVTKNLSVNRKYPWYLPHYIKSTYSNATEYRDAYYRKEGTSILSRVRLLSDEELYCLYLKYKCVESLLREADNVLLLDVDTIIRGDLDEIFSHSYDIMLKQVNKYEYITFQEGACCFTSNDKTETFIRDICKFCREHKTDWQADQLFFRKEYYERNIGIRFGALPTEYRSCVGEGLNEKSIIWSGVKDSQTIS